MKHEESCVWSLFMFNPTVHQGRNQGYETSEVQTMRACKARKQNYFEHLFMNKK